MKKYLSLLVLFSITVLTVGAQSKFQKTLEGEINMLPSCADVIETSDGSIISTGVAKGGLCEVVKLGSNGDTTWTLTLDWYTLGIKIIETNDNNYLVLATSYLVNRYMTIIKVDQNRNVLWSWRIGDFSDGIKSIGMVEATDGSIYLLGRKGASTSGLLVKLNADGSVNWNTYIKAGTGGTEKMRDLLATPDGGVLILGDTEDAGQGMQDFLVVKVDSAGTIEWSKTIGGSKQDEARTLFPTYDGGYVLTGFTNSYGPVAGWHTLVVKVDSVGTVKWSTVIAKNFDFTQPNDIIENNAHEFIIAGDFNTEPILSKLDTGGAYLWTKTYDHGTNNGYISSVFATADDGLLLGGSLSGGSFGKWYILKGDSTGSAGCGNESTISTLTPEYPTLTSVDVVLTANVIAVMDTEYSTSVYNTTAVLTEDTICSNSTVGVGLEDRVPFALEIYPNPAGQDLYLKSDLPLMDEAEYYVYDIRGAMVASGSLEYPVTNIKLNLGSGLFILDVHGENGQQLREKFIIR